MRRTASSATESHCTTMDGFQETCGPLASWQPDVTMVIDANATEIPPMFRKRDRAKTLRQVIELPRITALMTNYWAVAENTTDPAPADDAVTV